MAEGTEGNVNWTRRLREDFSEGTVPNAWQITIPDLDLITQVSPNTEEEWLVSVFIDFFVIYTFLIFLGELGL